MRILHDPQSLAVLLGISFALGVTLLVAGLVPRTSRLSDVLGLLDGRVPTPDAAVIGDESGLDARVGRWAYVRLRLPVGDASLQRLAIAQRTVSDFLAQKLLLAFFGLVVPQVCTGVLVALGEPAPLWPLWASLLCAAGGFFWPDIALRRGHLAATEDAASAMLAFFDLVTLERLANHSAIASLHAASSVSDSLVFRRIREALERARLEQRAPWSDLERLAEELELPEIRDLSDVLRLDEQGASLSDTLRARLRELRDAHLTSERVAAQKVSESLTIWMVLPTLALALLLVAAPLLKILGT